MVFKVLEFYYLVYKLEILKLNLLNLFKVNKIGFYDLRISGYKKFIKLYVGDDW